MILPVGTGQLVGRIKDGDGAAFVSGCGRCRRLVTASSGAVVGADVLRLLEQGRLVVLDLDDQGEIGVSGDLEVFF